MKSLFYALSVAAVAAAGFFGWQVKDKHAQQLELRDGLVEANKKQSKSIDEKEGLRKEAEDALEVAKGEVSEAKAGLETAVSSITANERTLKDVESDLKAEVAKEANVKEVEESIKGLFPGTPLDEVPQVYEGLKKEKKDLTADLLRLEDEKKNLERSVAKAKADIVRVKGRIAESKERVANNVFQATVTGVDSNWGFVEIGAGENSGLSPESRLLVQRGGRLLGKLKVHRVEANRAIADIVPDSVRPGVVLQPGDQVILENTVSN